MPAVAKIQSYIFVFRSKQLILTPTSPFWGDDKSIRDGTPIIFSFLSNLILFRFRPIPFAKDGKGFSAEFYANYAAKLLGNFQKSFES